MMKYCRFQSFFSHFLCIIWLRFFCGETSEFELITRFEVNMIIFNDPVFSAVNLYVREINRFRTFVSKTHSLHCGHTKGWRG